METCGKTLEEYNKLLEARNACRIEEVERALDDYGI